MRRVIRAAEGVWPFLALLAAWYIVASMHVVPARWLPGPDLVLRAGWAELQSGVLLADVGVSLARLGMGFGLGAGLGVFVGLAMGTNRFVAMFFDPLANFFQSIGGITWVPLAVLWFGFGWGSVLFVIFNTVFFIVLFNTLAGVESVPRNLIYATRTLGGRQRTIIREVLIPGALPSIVNGLRLGIGFGWRALIAAEMITASSGLGFRIYDAAAYWKNEEIIFGLIVIGVLWMITDYGLLRRLEARTIERWGLVRTTG
jgi:NitT/TauT family transport system permease protein/taurine transport system permease protein